MTEWLCYSPSETPSSYRPVSLLSMLAKILDRLILERLQNRVNTHLASPVMMKAFDGDWQDALIAKLHNYHVPLWLVKYVQSFLLDGSFRVRVEDSLYKSRTMGGRSARVLIITTLISFRQGRLSENTHSNDGTLCG